MQSSKEYRQDKHSEKTNKICGGGENGERGDESTLYQSGNNQKSGITIGELSFFFQLLPLIQ